jgi:hypothetical protein
MLVSPAKVKPTKGANCHSAIARAGVTPASKPAISNTLETEFT